MADKPREPPGYKPPQSAEELLARYATGERSFISADLGDADLEDAYLGNTDFGFHYYAYLRGADPLGNADLISAYLSGANLSHADLRGADLRRAHLRDADLSCTNLNGANLSRAHLRLAHLSDADLSGANLRDAELSYTDLSYAHFCGADLSRAHLNRAILSGADLRGANLSHADLSGAIVSGANLSGANLSGAYIGGTILLDVDLAPLCEANPPTSHSGESSVNFSAIVRSILAPRLEDFLVRTGLPAITAQYMIECAKAVGGRAFDMMRSTFISYGSPDETFARKLYEALHKNGVRVFLFSEHAEPGERLHRMMRKGVNEHDRVVLVCSKASLDRKGVMNELEETLAREAREGGETFLIPIRLDDYVFTGWKPKREDIAQAVRDRVVADFEGADTDPTKFDAALSKLLRALRVKAGSLDPSGGAGP